MVHQSLVFRAATPAIDEGMVFARYLDKVAGGFFRFMLGPRVTEILAAAYMQPNHNYSYQNVTFAECDGVIAGMVSGYTTEQHRRFSDEPLKEAAGKHALRMRSVTILCAPLLRILDTIGDGDYYIQAMIVDEERRGGGVGSALMDFVENRARSAGSRRLTLDVAAKNEGARKLYERRGMTVESEWPNIALVPAVFVRMTKPL
jgi:ribosomal protein S18 acetylase RimI-like enzyme